MTRFVGRMNGTTPNSTLITGLLGSMAFILDSFGRISGSIRSMSIMGTIFAASQPGRTSDSGNR